MPTIAFWNIHNTATARQVTALARESNADILVLAECPMSSFDILEELNIDSERSFFADQGNSDKLVILTRFAVDADTLIGDQPGVSFRHYQASLGDPFLVAAVHLPSKLYRNAVDHAFVSARLARYIRDAEEQVGHTRTIVVGDLNMDPFEPGVVGTGGLHATMDRRIAGRKSRTVRGEAYDFFYNPMWAHFGDAASSVPGTYYYDSSKEMNYFWHIFDQVLVRPALLTCLPNDCVSIVTELEGESLLSNLGRPNPAAGSDHLPITLRFSETEGAFNVIGESVG